MLPVITRTSHAFTISHATMYINWNALHKTQYNRETDIPREHYPPGQLPSRLLPRPEFQMADVCPLTLRSGKERSRVRAYSRPGGMSWALLV